MMSAGAACRGGRLSRCGMYASGYLAWLWRAFPVACGQLCLASHLAGLWGFPVALPAVSLNAHADGWRVSGMMSAAYIGGRLLVLGLVSGVITIPNVPKRGFNFASVVIIDSLIISIFSVFNVS